MTHDYNDADKQRSFDVIPDGTICTVRMIVRPGNAGEGGMLKRSKDGKSEALDCEFIVQDGEHAKRRFYGLFTLEGETQGHIEAGRISQSKLRAILESARGIDPNDTSEAAKAARRTTSYADFNRLCFMCRVGVDPPTNGYKAKNKLDYIITPEDKAWKAVPQQPQQPAATSAPASSPARPASNVPAPIQRPAWGQRG